MAEPETPRPRPGKHRRNIGRIVLVVSLALNLLIAGLVAGAFLHGPPRPHRGAGLDDLGFGPFVAALPAADRRALADEMGKQEGSFRERRAALRSQFEALLTALRADPYDHEAVRQIVTAQDAEIRQSRALGSDLLLSHIAAMSDAGRKAYADALADGVRRWKPGRRPRD